MPGRPSCAITASSGSIPCCSRRSRPRKRAMSSRPRIAFDWKNGFDKLKNGTNTERYLLPHGKPAVAGDVIHQPELGQTLRAIAKNGRDAFYTGAIAEDMVETLRGIGGLHTLEDFAAPYHRDHGADRHHVQGPRRLAVPAERSGHHHAGDAEHPVALRSDEIPGHERRAVSSRSRSRADRLHDARAVYRRSRPCRRRRGPDPVEGIRRRTWRQDPDGPACSICRTWRRR